MIPPYLFTCNLYKKELSSDGFFSKVIQTRKRASQDNPQRQREALVFLTEYNLNKGSLITELDLVIGSN